MKFKINEVMPDSEGLKKFKDEYHVIIQDIIKDINEQIDQIPKKMSAELKNKIEIQNEIQNLFNFSLQIIVPENLIDREVLMSLKEETKKKPKKKKTLTKAKKK